MRITGGTAGGRRIRVPDDGVRPSQDRLRESLFSMLAPVLPGARVLDLFAGSGALGLEAWSRGASAVCWVERSPRILRTLRANIDDLCGVGVAGLHCLCGDARAPGRFSAHGPFTLVLADPPYGQTRGGCLVRSLLQELLTRAMMTPGGVVAVEQPAAEPAAEVPAWQILRDRTVGRSRIVLYRPVRKEGKTGEHEQCGDLSGQF